MQVLITCLHFYFGNQLRKLCAVTVVPIFFGTPFCIIALGTFIEAAI